MQGTHIGQRFLLGLRWFAGLVGPNMVVLLESDLEVIADSLFIHNHFQSFVDDCIEGFTHSGADGNAPVVGGVKPVPFFVSPFNALYGSKRILYFILLSAGSQCSSCRVIVIGSYFPSPAITQAAVF